MLDVELTKPFCEGGGTLASLPPYPGPYHCRADAFVALPHDDRAINLDTKHECSGHHNPKVFLHFEKHKSRWRCSKLAP